MLVLDANILIRAVLGVRVPWLLDRYADRGEFFAPDSAFREAREELPVILKRREMPTAPGLATLDTIYKLVRTVEIETYTPMEAIARQRLARRDEDDWPILAAALALDYPIWTEVTDFFGCGVATWTTDRVELYLAGVAP
jgi:predicted nucleic acid-binding protein